MKTQIEVLSVEHKSGRSKTGTDYSLDICQCIVREPDADGQVKIQIGELVLPKNHPTVTPGQYEGTFGISVGQDKRIGGRLIQLTPLPVSRSSVPPRSPSADSQKPA